MDGYLATRWSKLAGIGLALALLAAMLSFRPGDPTLLQPLYPMGGVENLLGLAGALAGGSLVALFGASALLVPPLILYWCLATRDRPARLAYLAYCGAMLLTAAALHGLADRGATVPALLSPGLLGLGGGTWAAGTLGPWPAGGALALVVATLADRLAYGNLARTALRTAGRAVAHLHARAWALFRSRGRRAASALHGAPLRLGGAARGSWAACRRWGARLGHLARSMPHPRGASGRPPPTAARRRASKAGHRQRAMTRETETAAFDAWFDDEQPGTPSAPARQGPPPAAPMAPDRGDWLQRARRYRQVLDL